MFKQRLLTALVLVPLVLVTIYYANYWTIAAVVLLLMTGCALEWLQLIPIERIAVKILFILALLAGCYLIQSIYWYWLCVGLAVWGVIVIFVYQFPRSQVIWGHPLIVGFFCLLLLPLFAQSLINILFNILIRVQCS